MALAQVRIVLGLLTLSALAACNGGSGSPAVPQSTQQDHSFTQSARPPATIAADAEMQAAILSGGNASTNPFTLKELPGSVILSMAQVGNDVWFADINEVDPTTSYLGRIASPSDISVYSLHDVVLGGKHVSITPLYVAADPATSGQNQRLVFDWVQYPSTSATSTTESGLGFAQPAQPAAPELIAGGKQGDPLYSARVTNPFFGPLVFTPSSGKLWGYTSTEIQQATGVWNLPYPLAPKPAYIATAVPNIGSLAPSGVDGDLWFLDGPSLGHVSTSGTLLASAPLQITTPFETHYGADGHFWVSSFYSLSKVDADGSVDATYAPPRFTYDPIAFTTSRTASWLYSLDAKNFYIERVGYDGAWSWYAVPRGKYTEKYVTAAMVSTGDTIYTSLSYPGNNAPPLILSFKKSRLIGVWPSSVNVAPGSPATVTVFESNFKGSFSGVQAPLGSIGAPASCPLTVSALPNNQFSIKATAAVPKGCSVQFTDSDNFATAQVYVNP